VVLVTCAAGLGFAYQVSVTSFALPQIQAGLGLDDERVGFALMAIRLGALPALGVSLVADRLGRRRALLASVVGFSVCSVVTGLARSPAEFVAAQVAARTFLHAQHLLGVVVVAEELRAARRGWGLGVLNSLGSLGGALALGLFVAIEWLPGGWRTMYLAGGLPLLLMPWLRRTLAETRRFAERDAEAAAEVPALRPLLDLVRVHPGRVGLLALATVPTFLLLATSFLFVSKYLQEDHGLSPPQVGLFLAGAGALSPLGSVLAGGLADRFGRRRVMGAASAVCFAGIAAFYALPTPWLPLAFGPFMLGSGMLIVLFHALGAELFPTGHRSTAGGAREILSTLGGALGLAASGALYAVTGSYAGAILWLLVLAPLPPLLVLLLPETAGRELEEISPD